MKTALVIDWPSVDPRKGGILSEWEENITTDLMKQAGFKPDVVLRAHNAHVKKWTTLFANGKPGGPLTQSAQATRDALIKDLQGYDMALTMGPHAMFCLTGETKIDTYRGTHIDSPFVPGLQVVPSYSPTIFSRFNWSERPVVVQHMIKARKRYQDSDRTIYLAESVADLYWYATKFIKKELVFDVETNKQRRITEFSISTSSKECLYVQLEDRTHNSIWSAEDELDIWLWLHFLACQSDLAWGFHNATYDLSYLAEYGIKPAGPIFDTMLRHHGWQPELEKSLGFLASMYIPTRAWKHLRTQAKNTYNKAGAL